jgi:hypothetical protein
MKNCFFVLKIKNHSSKKNQKKNIERDLKQKNWRPIRAYLARLISVLFEVY